MKNFADVYFFRRVLSAEAEGRSAEFFISYESPIQLLLIII